MLGVEIVTAGLKRSKNEERDIRERWLEADPRLEGDEVGWHFTFSS